MPQNVTPCPVCHHDSRPIARVDFNKSCEDVAGNKPLPVSGDLVRYDRCGDCGTVFAPLMCSWGSDEFAQRIYNDEYPLVDPEVTGARADRNALVLAKIAARFLDRPFRHLDYGGGIGHLSRVLRKFGWDSVTYDPYLSGSQGNMHGLYDIVSAFEVFEHVQDPVALMSTLNRLVRDDGAVLMTTVVINEYLHEIESGQWWYMAPRNGHICLHSSGGLQHLASLFNFSLVSLCDGFHAFVRKDPKWAFLSSVGNPWDWAEQQEM